MAKKQQNTINRGYFQYKMSEQMVKAYLHSLKSNKDKSNPQAALCKWVNDNFGIAGTCVEVIW